MKVLIGIHGEQKLSTMWLFLLASHDKACKTSCEFIDAVPIGTYLAHPLVSAYNCGFYEISSVSSVLAQLGTLDIPGFDVDQFQMWIGQTQHIPTLITQLLSGQTTNGKLCLYCCNATVKQ